MKTEEILNAVQIAHQVDKANNPSFPDHVCAQVAKVLNPVGKMNDIAIVKKYNLHFDKSVCNKMLEDQAINTIVQAIRFLENLK